CATDKVSKQVNLPQKLQNSSSVIIKKSQELPLYLLLSNTLLPGVTRQRTNKQNLVCKQILLQATKVILELINLFFLKIWGTKSTTKWRTYLCFVSIDHTNTALCRIKMTRQFQVYLNPSVSSITYSCVHCRAHLADHNDLISKAFQGSQGRAYLFDKVVNVKSASAEDRLLLTGQHRVADLHCAGCNSLLGWKYERAFEVSQRYKEGKYIIELAHLIKENRWTESCLPSSPSSGYQSGEATSPVGRPSSTTIAAGGQRNEAFTVDSSGDEEAGPLSSTSTQQQRQPLSSALNANSEYSGTLRRTIGATATPDVTFEQTSPQLNLACLRWSDLPLISYLLPPYRVMGKLTDIIPLVFFGGLLIALSCTIKRIKEKNNLLGYRDLTSLSTAVTSPDACHGVSNGGMLKSRNIKLQICGTLPSQHLLENDDSFLSHSIPTYEIAPTRSSTARRTPGCLFHPAIITTSAAAVPLLAAAPNGETEMEAESVVMADEVEGVREGASLHRPTSLLPHTVTPSFSTEAVQATVTANSNDPSGLGSTITSDANEAVVFSAALE
uniref:Yippee domain-containing protein n=1 Tax=Echinococcus canadensis TaxID=519352 RepID=A0A915EVL4_9CEST